MDLSNLKPAQGSKHSKKRIGRGQGSGQGVQAGRDPGPELVHLAERQGTLTEGGRHPVGDGQGRLLEDVADQQLHVPSSVRRSHRHGSPSDRRLF